MEFSLSSFDGALPVEVTIDEDNGRFMIRKSDSSGEFFNSPGELIDWVKSNLRQEDFCDSGEFQGMLDLLERYQMDPSLFYY
jgi:hypothetical protein